MIRNDGILPLILGPTAGSRRYELCEGLRLEATTTIRVSSSNFWNLSNTEGNRANKTLSVARIQLELKKDESRSPGKAVRQIRSCWLC